VSAGDCKPGEEEVEVEVSVRGGRMRTPGRRRRRRGGGGREEEEVSEKGVRFGRVPALGLWEEGFGAKLLDGEDGGTRGGGRRRAASSCG
jgi:hypothetical protein